MDFEDCRETEACFPERNVELRAGLVETEDPAWTEWQRWTEGEMRLARDTCQKRLHLRLG